jgi:hypothetical protein
MGIRTLAALAVALAGAGPIDQDIADVVANATSLTDDYLRALGEATPTRHRHWSTPAWLSPASA